MNNKDFKNSNNYKVVADAIKNNDADSLVVILDSLKGTYAVNYVLTILSEPASRHTISSLLNIIEKHK